MTWPPEIRIVEVGPRDGLQNEPKPVEVKARIVLIEGLANAGLRSIECGSFVSPKWVPQMAGTEDVFTGLRRVPQVSYSTLAPNLEGLAAAKRSQVNEVALFVSASETFSQKNINCSIEESLERCRSVAREASGLRIRGYVSCVLGCPYEGEIKPQQVAAVSAALLKLGCDEISLGDTIGVGTPAGVLQLLPEVASSVPVEKLAVHFHDTYGQALANVLAALDFGVNVVDSSVAGLGGCPYAPGAAGNLASEQLVYMLNGMGIETGVDLAKLSAAGQAICRVLGRPYRFPLR